MSPRFEAFTVNKLIFFFFVAISRVTMRWRSLLTVLLDPAEGDSDSC